MALIFRQNGKSGFTLLELSAVIVIISLMLGGILAAATQEIRREKRAELKMKMDAIEKALLSYAKNPTYYAIPCPADPTLATSSNSFGVAAASGCASVTTVYNNKIFGSVPVRSLGLPDDYAVDPWGNRFTYVVVAAAATTGVFNTSDLSAAAITGLRAVDLSDNVVDSNVMAFVISHGETGFGAYTADGVRKSGYSTNGAKLINCFCTTDGSLEDTFAIGNNDIYVASNFIGGTENIFDDVVRYYNRNFFLLTRDLQTDVSY